MVNVFSQRGTKRESEAGDGGHSGTGCSLRLNLGLGVGRDGIGQRQFAGSRSYKVFKVFIDCGRSVKIPLLHSSHATFLILRAQIH